MLPSSQSPTASTYTSLVTFLSLGIYHPFMNSLNQPKKHENKLDMRGLAQVKGQYFLQHVCPAFPKLVLDSQHHNIPC